MISVNGDELFREHGRTGSGVIESSVVVQHIHVVVEPTRPAPSDTRPETNVSAVHVGLGRSFNRRPGSKV
jgi:hypothetical protein